MSNIEEMEEKKEYFREKALKVDIGDNCFIDYRYIVLFMEACINELKSQADRMARLEKAMAEMRKIKEETNVKSHFDKN